MADKNEYKTVLKISAEGDAQGVDAFTESLKRLKSEAQGGNAELSKSAAQAKAAADGMAQAAGSAERLGGAQKSAGDQAEGWYGKTRKGLESVSRGVGMLNRLVTGFGLIGVITNAIALFKTLKEAINATRKEAEAAALEIAKLDIADMARQTEALASAQERAADAAARQFENLNKIATAKAAEQDAGLAADLAELDAEEQRALSDSLANDPANEAGRTAMSAEFAARRRKLQRDRALAAKQSALDQSAAGTADARRTAADRERDVSETEERMAEVNRQIGGHLARADAALDPIYAPKKKLMLLNDPDAMTARYEDVVDQEEQKRITDEAATMVEDLKKQRKNLAARLEKLKGAADSAEVDVQAAEFAERTARTEYRSEADTSPRRDAALDAMDALRVLDARRSQSARLSQDKAAVVWDAERERDRKAADAALPGLYRQKGAIDSEKIALESKEGDARSALNRLRAGEDEARWRGRQALADTSKSPRERRAESDAQMRTANAFAADAKRTEAALETIEASFRSVAEKSERIAARIRDTEQRSTAGSADVFQP